MVDKSAEQQALEKRSVECFGMTFESDEERRAYFLDKLREKLKDPDFRKIEGFPIGKDEDILGLSDPPYYTACPNPFIEDFIRCYGKPYEPNAPYNREPLAADVSEGKNDPIYNAHSYHAKVPHKAVMRYIEHYTQPADIVFDGFCGTGMTGLAAQAIGLTSTDGSRRAILFDISPAATEIAATYNLDIDVSSFRERARELLEGVRAALGHLYSTSHTGWPTSENNPKKRINARSSHGRDGTITHTIWSDVFACPHCGEEIVFWDAAADLISREIRDVFACPNCRAEVGKRNLEKVYETVLDVVIGETRKRPRQVPVLIGYRVGKKRYEKLPDPEDLNRIGGAEKALNALAPAAIKMMFRDGVWGDEWRKGRHTHVTHAHDFFFARPLCVLLDFVRRIPKSASDRHKLLWLATSVTEGSSKLNRERLGGLPSKLSGTLYIGSTIREPNVIEFLERKIDKLPSIRAKRNHVLISTQSATWRSIPNDTIDYVFIDPPFGENLQYSELNFLWEYLLHVFTSTSKEAVVSKTQQKGLQEYYRLMERSFMECYRVLKPSRWMTVEFHNSRNAVWNAIQLAIAGAGFVVADIRVLDKKIGSFKQVTAAGAVKQDLVISAYKPNSGLEERFSLEAGTEDGVWDFMRVHLRQLPVFVAKEGKVEVIAERQNFLLFDRMVAFHVQRGIGVPVSAAEFYRGLAQRFPEREGMYFLPEQVAEYDGKRMTAKEVLQLEIFVVDESSAIQWLKQQLTQKPQTFQELHSQFIREIGGWQKHEEPLELSELLGENFLRYDGDGEVPSQIHGYLSTNFKELRKLSEEEPALRIRAKDRWYVPDPKKSGDLEKLRDRALLREFEEYRESKQRQLRVFRLEAVRAGFKKAWQDREYTTIIAVAKKIPEDVLLEDPKLLMWYDQALTRTGGQA